VGGFQGIKVRVLEMAGRALKSIKGSKRKLSNENKY